MTVDTSTAAITDRCQHLDHCAHDGKSEDAARMMALLSERDEWMSAFVHFLSEIPLQDVLGASGSVQDAIDYFKATIAERDALRDQLAVARNEALEEALLKIRSIAEEHEKAKETLSAIAVYDAGTAIRALAQEGQSDV